MDAEKLGVGRRALNVGAWAIASRIVSKSIDLCMLLCLARFVGPDDFGLVAVAMAAVFVVEALFELPVSAMLIRVDVLTADRLQTALTLSLLRGFAIAAMLVLVAMPLAAFCGEPRLISLLAVLSIAPAFRGMTSPRLVEYSRAFDPRPDVFIELSGKATAFVVAVTVAVSTHSYWAIAAATVCSPLAGTLLSYVIAPLRPHPTLVCWREFSHVIGWNFVAQLCGALSWQVDRLVLPRVTTTTAFGQYAMSKQLSELPVQALITPLHKPAIAVLSRTASSREAAYLQLSRAATLVLMPISGIFILWPEAVVGIALGGRWSSAAEWLRWNSAILVPGIPAMLLAPLALAMNDTKKLAIRNLAELAIKVPLVSAGAWYGGIACALAGIAVAAIVGSVFAMATVRAILGTGLPAQLRMLSQPVLSMIPAGALLLAAKALSSGRTTALELMVVFLPAALLYFLLYACCGYWAWRLAGRPAGLERQLLLAANSVFKKRVGGKSMESASCR